MTPKLAFLISTLLVLPAVAQEHPAYVPYQPYAEDVAPVQVQTPQKTSTTRYVLHKQPPVKPLSPPPARLQNKADEQEPMEEEGADVEETIEQVQRGPQGPKELEAPSDDSAPTADEPQQ